MNKICRPYKEASQNTISQGFCDTHKAIDMFYSYGTFLVAPTTCRVEKIITAETYSETLTDAEKAYMQRGFGILMRSIGDPRYAFLYWHCLPVFPVSIGDIVNQGQIVAQMGNSGFVTSGGQYVPIEIRTKAPYLGTHVHYEMTQDDEIYLNPLDYIDWTIPIKYDIITAIRAILTRMMTILKNR